MSKTILETVSGVMFDVMNPQPEMVNFEDIAWSLSRQARFNGHTTSLVPYSVAQHSIMVAKRVAKHCPKDCNQADLVRAALLHDAPECYISDIPSPIKHIPGFREQIKSIEDKILTVILNKLNVPQPSESGWHCIEEADMWCRAVEAHAFMYSRGRDWEGLPKPSFIELQNFEDPLTSLQAYERFKDYFSHTFYLKKAEEV